MDESKIIEIDGSFGEGGGAIIRLSAAFSILFNQPIRIKNIRANRPNPGLRTQHLLGLKTLAELTNSQLSDCKVGTKEITFLPNKKVKDNIQVNIGTAASIGLLLQPLLIASLGFKKPEKIELFLSGGGTFGKWAPSLNYLQKVTFPLFRNSGLDIKIQIQRHGMYPKGGAKVNCKIYPSTQELKPIDITELGNIDLIQGEIIITNDLRRPRDNIGAKIRKSIHQKIRTNLKIPTDIKYEWVNSSSSGVGLSLWAKSDSGAIISTGTLLGEKNLSSEKLGSIAANELLKYINNEIPVDNYLSDQLIPLMAYVKKPSRIKVLEITSHTKTNLELIKKFQERDYKVIKEKSGHIIEYL